MADGASSPISRRTRLTNAQRLQVRPRFLPYGVSGMATFVASSMEVPSPQDFGEVFNLIGGYRISQAIYVVVELGIPDLLAEGPRHCDELATETNTHAPTLYRILRFLAGAALFNEVGPKNFELTRQGATLRTDVPGSLRCAVRFLLGEFEWTPWGRLIHSART